MWQIVLLITVFCSAHNNAATPFDASPDQRFTRVWQRRLLIVSVVFFFLFLFTERPNLHPDSVGYFLMARECVNFGLCGKGSAVRGFWHGAVTVQILAACRLLGLGVMATKAVVAALCAV